MLGISVDSIPTLQGWQKSLGGIIYPLLSDFWPHGQVARLYGIFREQDGFAERANIIVDETGKVVFSKVYEISRLPDLDEIIQVLKGL